MSLWIWGTRDDTHVDCFYSVYDNTPVYTQCLLKHLTLIFSDEKIEQTLVWSQTAALILMTSHWCGKYPAVLLTCTIRWFIISI